MGRNTQVVIENNNLCWSPGGTAGWGIDFSYRRRRRMSLWPPPTTVSDTRQTAQTPSGLSPVAVARAGLTAPWPVHPSPKTEATGPWGKSARPRYPPRPPHSSCLCLLLSDLLLGWGPLGVCVLGCFRHVRLFLTLWTIAHQLPLSMGFWNSMARVLEWVAISSSGGSSPPKDRTHVSSISCIIRQILYHQRHWS